MNTAKESGVDGPYPLGVCASGLAGPQPGSGPGAVYQSGVDDGHLEAPRIQSPLITGGCS